MLQDSALQGGGMVKKHSSFSDKCSVSFKEESNRCCHLLLWMHYDRHSWCRIAPFARTLIQTPCRDTVCNQAVVVNHRNQRIPEQIECTEFNSWAQLASECWAPGSRNGGVTDIRESQQTRIKRKREKKGKWVPTVVLRLNSIMLPWCDLLIPAMASGLVLPVLVITGILYFNYPLRP